jgi:myo-inositol-1(or 4)-monophosphatase
LPAVDEAVDVGLSGDLALIVGAARDAGQIALKYFRNSPEVWMKGGTSPVSEADYAVDHFLRDVLMTARPDYGWLSEETTDGEERLTARRLFVVDPIDGTRGFLSGDARWCVSIAVVEAGRPIAGTLECPARRETFSAAPGQGAFKNGELLTVGPVRSKPRVGGPKNMTRLLPPRVLRTIDSVPYVPSLAYRLAMIADGALDGTFVKPNSHDWDLAAADLILDEAGGRLLDARGGRPGYGGAEVRHGALAAGSGDLLEVLARVISGRFG